MSEHTFETNPFTGMATTQVFEVLSHPTDLYGSESVEQNLLALPEVAFTPAIEAIEADWRNTVNNALIENIQSKRNGYVYLLTKKEKELEELNRQTAALKEEISENDDRIAMIDVALGAREPKEEPTIFDELSDWESIDRRFKSEELPHIIWLKKNKFNDNANLIDWVRDNGEQIAQKYGQKRKGIFGRAGLLMSTHKLHKWGSIYGVETLESPGDNQEIGVVVRNYNRFVDALLGTNQLGVKSVIAIFCIAEMQREEREAAGTQEAIDEMVRKNESTPVSDR